MVRYWLVGLFQVAKHTIRNRSNLRLRRQPWRTRNLSRYPRNKSLACVECKDKHFAVAAFLLFVTGHLSCTIRQSDSDLAEP